MSHRHTVTRVSHKPVVTTSVVRTSHKPVSHLTTSHHHHPVHTTSVHASGVSSGELHGLKDRYEKEEIRLKLEIDELTENNLRLENVVTKLKGDLNVWESECNKLKLLLK